MAMDGSTFRHQQSAPPLICFSHLRWEFVFQRPQHLMSRFAANRRVFFFEEAVAHPEQHLNLRLCPMTGVTVATPMLPDPTDVRATRNLLDELLVTTGPAIAWYYTPIAVAFSSHVPWLAVAYDCMDELSGFRFAPAEMRLREQRLINSADIMFTGGASLFAAKQHLHKNIHCVPSGVDLGHFFTARGLLPEPEVQARIRRPAQGYFGVIDERLDMGLLAGIAALRPDWQIIMVGPVAKLTPEELPQASNIHWLGGQSYQDLPAFLSHWDVALMPFALNEATRFISPTKAPEYLAGGCRVISTPVADVVSRFAGIGAVTVASDAEGFVAAAAAIMACSDVSDFVAVDDLLATMSWDSIADEMTRLLAEAQQARRLARPALRSNAPLVAADYTVVGAGFAGAVVAERLATAGHSVCVVDRRPHIAGNAYDEYDASGVLVHRYGPHIFHTNSDAVLAYLSRFTAWRPYEHRVLAQLGDRLVPMPINRTTLNEVLGTSLTTDAQAEAFLQTLGEPVAEIRSARDFVVSAVGQRLYEMFFEGYSRKQWGMDPSELDRAVTARVPTRASDDDRYFQDRHQCMPAQGYTRMFEKMLDHPNITIRLSTDYAELGVNPGSHLVFSGPVDSYFGMCFGPLPYRSLVFEHETREVDFVQPVGTINYPGMETPYTRCSEFKHITGQKHRFTSLCREKSSATGEPFYPIPNAANQALYKRYEALADAEAGVTFLGRLGTYRYMNMDQVVAQALTTARRLVEVARVKAAAE